MIRTQTGRRGAGVLYCALGLMLCNAGGPAAAQEAAEQQAAPQGEVRRITPDEAVSLAVKNNLSLESARVTANVKKRESNLSWNQFIPNVTIGGSLIMDNEQGPPVSATIPIPGTGQRHTEKGISGELNPWVFVTDPIDVPRWHIGASIQVSLNINLAMFENIRRLRLDYEGGVISFRKAKSQLERDVRKAYHNMLLIQENIALLRENYEAARRRVETAQANYQAGLAPELVLLQARVAMENMNPVIDQAENGLKLAMAQFAMYLGLPYNDQFELIPLEEAPSYIPLDVADMISKAAAGKPDIQELRQSILLMRSARQAQIFSLTPTLGLSWNTTPAFTGDPWKDNWGDDDLWRKSGSLTISLGLRLHSLLPYSQDFQGIINMDDQLRIANIGLAQMIRGTELEIYNTVLSLERTQSTAEAQERTVNLAERTYQLTDEAYRAGLQDLLEVQNAELSLRQAKVQMLEQQFNYLNGLIDLEYSIGVPFGTLSAKGSE